MEKNNFLYAAARQGAFPSYAFDYDYSGKPGPHEITSPSILHIPRKRKERRGCRRYAAARGAFALLRSQASILSDIENMNMGEIAFAVMRSKPAKLGQIVNISRRGLVFRNAQTARCATPPSRLDILLADCRFYLDSLKFDLVADVRAPDVCEFDSVETRLISVKFKSLTDRQKKQLDCFLTDHTADLV